jgi:hypothetical protein
MYDFGMPNFVQSYTRKGTVFIYLLEVIEYSDLLLTAAVLKGGFYFLSIHIILLLQKRLRTFMNKVLM